MRSRIRAERRARRWTLEQFGRLIGVDASMVSLIETGKRQPSAEVRAAIARELKLPAEYLFTPNDLAVEGAA